MDLFIVEVAEDYYEENSVLGVFDTQEKAETALINWLNNNDNENCNGDWGIIKLNEVLF